MNVLVVVHNEETRRLIGEVLHAGGHAVVEAADARSALRALATALPDLVVVDTTLRDRPGVDVLRVIRETPDGDRVVAVLLAANPAAYEEEAHRLDLVAVIRKPVDVLDLSDLVRDVATVRAARPDLIGATEPEPVVASPPRGPHRRPARSAPPIVPPGAPSSEFPPPRAAPPDLHQLLGVAPDAPPELVAERCDLLLAEYMHAAWTERSLLDRAHAASAAARLRTARRHHGRPASPADRAN